MIAVTNVDNFKSFVRKNPRLLTHVRNGTMSWQKFYEMYDLYGEDENIWNEYLKSSTEEKSSKEETRSAGKTLSSIIEMAKNIDTDKLQDGITSIQKAIGLFGDMLTKDSQSETSTYTPRQIYRRFDD